MRKFFAFQLVRTTQRLFTCSTWYSWSRSRGRNTLKFSFGSFASANHISEDTVLCVTIHRYLSSFVLPTPL